MKKIKNYFKRLLSFHVIDVVGIITTVGLIAIQPDTQSLFYLLGNPTFYLILLLVAFLGRSLFWLLILRGETFYLKHSVISFLEDYFRLVIVSLCAIGCYLFFFTVL